VLLLALAVLDCGVGVSGMDVASVSGAGVALGKNVGQAAVSATCLGKSASATLTVTPATLAALTMSATNPAIRKGATRQFTATGTLSDGTTQDLTNLVSEGHAFTAARPAGREPRIPGVRRIAVELAARVEAEREVREVCASQRDRAGRAETRDHRRVA
jgi:hypothetical protein